MRNKDELLVHNVDGGINNMYSQMMAPFYALSNFFLSAVNPSADDVSEESERNNERPMFTLNPSKISQKVYSILEQKAQANELEDYLAKLVEQDIGKIKTEETKSLFDTLREELLSEVDFLKQNQKENISTQDHNLRDIVTKLGEQKLDKDEFQTLFNSFRTEILEQITLLKNELASLPDVSRTPRNSIPVFEPNDEAGDLKEGQLLENSQVTGTIKEVIDVDF
jgi:hypothetical protein